MPLVLFEIFTRILYLPGNMLSKLLNFEVASKYHIVD